MAMPSVQATAPQAVQSFVGQPQMQQVAYAPQVVTYAPQTVSYSAPQQLVYMQQAPGQQMVYNGAPQQVVYAADPGQVVYVDQNGQQVALEQDPGQQQQQQQVVYVDQNGQQVEAPEQQSQQQQQIVYEVPQQPQVIQYIQPPTMTAPKVYSISPEQFAHLAQGGTLSQEQINAMMGGQGAAPPEQANGTGCCMPQTAPEGMVSVSSQQTHGNAGVMMESPPPPVGSVDAAAQQQTQVAGSVMPESLPSGNHPVNTENGAASPSGKSSSKKKDSADKKSSSKKSGSKDREKSAKKYASKKKSKGCC